MELKQVTVIDPSASGGKKAISVNLDKIVRVNPFGADDSEIVLENGDVLRSHYSYAETVQWLSN